MKRELAIFALMAAAATISACGGHDFDGDGNSNEDPTPTPTPNPDSEVPQKEKGDLASELPVSFSGFIGGAFPISVDGVNYDDSEDFFTQESARLPEKVAAAGYNSEWSVRFDAAIGFSDLRANMVVYIAPNARKGYQGEGTVGSAGAFNISLPKEAVDTVYQVRAVKRIHVVLTKGDETKRFCYNFSAVDKSVNFSDREKPIILDSFATKITTYACASSTSGGITVPSAANSIAQTAEGQIVGKLVKGDSKADVLSKWGNADSVSVNVSNSTTEWIYAKTARSAADLVATGERYSWVTTVPRCKLLFDATGLKHFSSECSLDFIQYDTF
jgi:hypothetical protein